MARYGNWAFHQERQIFLREKARYGNNYYPQNLYYPAGVSQRDFFVILHKSLGRRVCDCNAPNFSFTSNFNNFGLKICATCQIDFLPKMWYHLTMEKK